MWKWINFLHLPFLHWNFPLVHLFSAFDYWLSWHTIIHTLNNPMDSDFPKTASTSKDYSRAPHCCSNTYFKCPGGNKRKDNVLGRQYLFFLLPKGGKWKQYWPCWWRTAILAYLSRLQWSRTSVSSKIGAPRQRLLSWVPWLLQAYKTLLPCCRCPAGCSWPHSSRCDKYQSATGFLTLPFPLGRARSQAS